MLAGSKPTFIPRQTYPDLFIVKNSAVSDPTAITVNSLPTVTLSFSDHVMLTYEWALYDRQVEEHVAPDGRMARLRRDAGRVDKDRFQRAMQANCAHYYLDYDTVSGCSAVTLRRAIPLRRDRGPSSVEPNRPFIPSPVRRLVESRRAEVRFLYTLQRQRVKHSRSDCSSRGNPRCSRPNQAVAEADQRRLEAARVARGPATHGES